MKYGLVWVISSFSLSGIVPFKWSSPTSLMTFFFFVSISPVACFALKWEQLKR